MDYRSDESEELQEGYSSERLYQKTWGIVPVLIACFWAAMCINSLVNLIEYLWCMWVTLAIAVGMLAVDYIAFRVLLKYSDRLTSIHPKRAELLSNNVMMCLMFWFFGVIHPIFLIVCPPLLFIANIVTYTKAHLGAKLFWSLIFTDPLLHYMAFFFYYIVQDM